jgi:5-formaminoimidazole-4-carboxamide-1-beta-D-ribofuranosyl 5'-monophosphate synthetase
MNEITIEQVKNIENRTERIELLHNMILTMKLKSFDFAVSIGEELTKQKEELPHGTFIKWIESNLPFMSRMTANNYIRVFENREMLRTELGERLELNLAYKWLNRKRKPKQVSKQDSVKEKVDSVLKDSIKENRKKTY